MRRRLLPSIGTDYAERLPRGYQRLGGVLILRLEEELRPFFPDIGAAWQAELGVATVLRVAGPVVGPTRHPAMEPIAGGSSETEVVEFGSRYRLDAARIMFARGNRTERQRIAGLVRPGESVADLFAGIGYFVIPIARRGRARTLVACEINPLAYQYLVQNVALNGVSTVVRPILGDNRAAALEPGAFDRVILGFLPSAVPWLETAIPLLRPVGGEVHTHLVADVRGGRKSAEEEVRSAVLRAGAEPLEIRSRSVKAYGPGRQHVVVDARVRPPSGRARG